MTNKLLTKDFNKSMLGFDKKKISRKPAKRKKKRKARTAKPKAVEKQKEFDNKRLPDKIDEFLIRSEGSKEAFHSRELFRAEKEDVDIKTELTDQEIVLINKLIFNNKVLKECGLDPVWEDFIYHYMRLKVSRNRQSRGEFVSINKGDHTDETINQMEKFSNIMNPKK